jgi:ribonucleoside-diphosphate reductase alpha chain
VRALRDEAIRRIWAKKIAGGVSTLHVEDIQDAVEGVLMPSGEQKVARAYVLYREHRARMRAETEGAARSGAAMHVTDDAGNRVLLPRKEISEQAVAACAGLPSTEPARIVERALKDLYEGAPIADVRRAMVMAAREMLEEDPAYSQVTARLLLADLRREVLGRTVTNKEMVKLYPSYFGEYIKRGIEAELLNPELAQFDIKSLGRAIVAARDLNFDYIGMQTIYDRYVLHVEDVRIELPQAFFMRVAMGLALKEPLPTRNARAIEFYSLLSSFDFMCSTPTLFNSGTLHSQLSSCYLTTISDDLEGIYEGIKENALLSKFAGGLGNDWTQVRSMGSHIKGTNGKSQGVVPFLKVANDTAVAVNQGGKRKGAVCAYLETWHLDIEEFFELRKNVGDDRRRTHDMNTANWIPDLFMKRVAEGADWTLFSPAEVPHLHDLHGAAFERAYIEAEGRAARGELKVSKKVPATNLWRKMLSMLFETGHPWITFKDPCNIRSPQQHVGVVHSSNLCTEITLNTNEEEIAVCNLGSVNLVAHMTEDGLDQDKLRRTITTAMRMLDNVIDINYYPVAKARTSNMRHRPVGLGIMGFQDCLYRMSVPYASREAVEFADTSMEAVCYHAYWASTDLAEERGAYQSFKGSLWDRGILPLDSIDMLARERGGFVEVDRSARLDWDALRQRIAAVGMRNSNCVAIAPTATIANIIGVDSSIEPSFQQLYAKSNLSGEFTVSNQYLVADLKRLNLWDRVMVADLKYFEGSLARISRVPQELRDLYQTAFEIDPSWLIEAASRRQKWIDQAQSLNLYVAAPSGKKLDEIYKLAWKRGLKTTYYLRAQGATHAEKSTGRGGELNAVSIGAAPDLAQVVAAEPKFCAIDNPDCEACQ